MEIGTQSTWAASKGRGKNHNGAFVGSELDSPGPWAVYNSSLGPEVWCLSCKLLSQSEVSWLI